jgi:hypothetical protein
MAAQEVSVWMGSRRDRGWKSRVLVARRIRGSPQGLDD